MTLRRISRDLARAVAPLTFGPPVTTVLHPLRYAQRPHEAYLERFGEGEGRVLLLGMNPGPWGMVQTGVPFGDVEMVRDWMGIEAPVEEPPDPHPERPVRGFACERREVSGTRLWSWARERYGSPARFFRDFFVWNYCPLAFLERSGRNRTPDRLPASEREPLFERCDRALARAVAELAPRLLVGVGAFAERRARAALSDAAPDLAVGRILHPSPASPRANRDWAGEATRQLEALGVEVPRAGDVEGPAR